MRLTVFFFLCLSLTSPAVSQWNTQWEKVDTISTGEYDDVNPVLLSGTFSFGSYPHERLVYERHHGIESFVASQRFRPEAGYWDSLVVPISKILTGGMPLLPDYSQLSYFPIEPNAIQHDFSLAAWQQSSGNTLNIYFSALRDNDSVWSEPKPLTQDSVSCTNAHVRPLKDSTFILTWKRKNLLLSCLATPSAMTPADTLAASAAEEFEYDITTRFAEGRLVWTSVDTGGQTFILARSIYTYPAFSLSPPETLLTARNVSNPKLVFGWYAHGVVLFDADTNGRRDVFAWRREYGSEAVTENVSLDPQADDRNARGFISPVVTKTNGASIASFVYFDAFIMERNSERDSALVFRQSISTDTLRSQGHNRNACIGSTMMLSISGARGPFVQSVWESNRTGRSHIYGRRIVIPFVGVEEATEGPQSFVLQQNYPNPFNSTTEIRFQIGDYGPVSLQIYDILGREVATLIDGPLKSGEYRVRWDASAFPSGVYFYRLSVSPSARRDLFPREGDGQSGRHGEVRKLLLIR